MKKILLVLIALLLIPSMANAQITKEQYYARSTLEGNELEFYDAVYDGVQNMCETAYVSEYGIDKEDVNTLIRFVKNDSPELFYADSYWTWEYNGDGVITSVDVDCVYSEEEIKNLTAQLEKETDKILSDIPENATDYEKVRAIYFYLGKTIEYDFDAVATEIYEEDQTVVGGILNKKAVCGGIAASLQYLLYQLDIPCYTVSSDTLSEGLHSVNIVKIDGEWYYCDLTYDMDKIKNGTLKYFLKDDIFTKTHMISEDLNPPLPACTSDKYMKAQEVVMTTHTPQRTEEPEEQKEPLTMNVFDSIIAAVVKFFTNIFG